jgi:hypothetical protein
MRQTNQHYEEIAKTLRGIAQTLEGLSGLTQDGTRFGEIMADELSELAQSAELAALEIERGDQELDPAAA